MDYPFSGFVSVSSEVIFGLRLCPPQHLKVGDELSLTTFAIGEGMFPTKLKIRDRKVPVAGEIYRCYIRRHQPKDFTDAHTGVKCRSRENVIVRLYPPEKVGFGSDGELRFSVGPFGTEPIVTPSPVYATKFAGIERQGVWWVAEPGTSYDVRFEGQQDFVLFSGSVLVQLGQLPERRVAGAVAMQIANRTSVYDRREDRMSSVARAEWIRRTVNNRSYEFINLRDVSLGEVVEAGGPEKILTPKGLEAVEEEVGK